MNIKDEILKAIKEITTEKITNGVEPTYALSPEVFRRVMADPKKYREAVRELIREKKILYGQTLNDFYFRIR